MPLHATGIGKVFLAFGEKAFTEAILAMPLARYTESTLTDCNSLTRELTKIRSQGYALSHQEYHPGSSSVAVPVFAGPVLKAAIGIVSYSMREDLDRHVPSMLEAAEKLGNAWPAEQAIHQRSDGAPEATTTTCSRSPAQKLADTP